MSVRVIFFGEKRLPPFLTARCLRVTGVGGSSGEKGSLLSVGLREVVCSLTRQRAQILCFGKNVSPLGCCLEGLFSSLYLLRWGRMMDAEGSDRKMSPPLSGFHLSILPRVSLIRVFRKLRFLGAWCTFSFV